jgi:diadenosine tetraphosphate (Ap4A) HIT family hydrolase
VYALHHVQLAMPHGREDDARQFFGAVLGMQETAKPPPLAGRGGVWFRAGDLELHLGVQEPFAPATKAHPGIMTDDLDALRARLADAGIDVTPDDNLPGFRRFYVNDCFGNRLEFLEPASSIVQPGRAGGAAAPGAVACRFCQRVASDDVTAANASAVAFPDAYPVTEGHTLVCPRHHVEDLFALEADAWAGLWALVREVKRRQVADLDADGWNVGANVGQVAGQTVAHAHVHLIPRRAGDVADPRGGVRWVLPERAAYWSQS